MTAAVNNRSDLDATANIKRARSLRAICLVSRNRTQIDIFADHINWNLSDSLSSIGMVDHSALAAEFSYFRDRLQHSGLIICSHDRDQDGGVIYRLAKLVQINEPALPHRQVG